MLECVRAGGGVILSGISPDPRTHSLKQTSFGRNKKGGRGVLLHTLPGRPSMGSSERRFVGGVHHVLPPRWRHVRHRLRVHDDDGLSGRRHHNPPRGEEVVVAGSDSASQIVSTIFFRRSCFFVTPPPYKIPVFRWTSLRSSIRCCVL